MSNDPTPPYFDPFSPACRDDPYPALAHLRSAAPFHWSPALKAWVATCHQDVKAILRDPACLPTDIRPAFAAMSAQVNGALHGAEMLLDAALLFERPPGHQLARRYLGRVLNARPLGEFVPVIERLCRELFDGGRRAGGLDFVKDFADPLPFRFMADLLGLPSSDVPYLVECCHEALFVFCSERSTSDDFFRIDHGVSLGLDYLEAEIGVRRHQPRDDGLTRMMQFGPDETPLSDREIAARSFFLFMVAVDTTSSFLPSALHSLLRHPAEFARWRRGEVEANAVVEELLRYTSPVQFTLRMLSEERTIHGVAIQAGQRLAAVIASANRDETVFERGDALDLGRKPGPHLAFGDGAHLCLGAALARLMSRTVFEQLLALPGLRSSAARPNWGGCEMIRKLKNLPLEFDTRP